MMPWMRWITCLMFLWLALQVPGQDADHGKRAQEVLQRIGRPDANVRSVRNASQRLVTVHFDDGGMVILSKNHGGISYSNTRESVAATKAADRPPVLTLEQARRRALVLTPSGEAADWEIAEARSYGPGNGELSGTIRIELCKRYYGRSTRQGDRIHVAFDASTGKIIRFFEGLGMKVTPPPAQVVPEEEARATALGALDRITDSRVREAAQRQWRDQRPRAKLDFDAPARSRPDSDPVVRSWPRDLRLMWRISGGDVWVTVDAETGILNAVDWAKSAGMPRRATPTNPYEPSERSRWGSPATWLWSLLGVPVVAIVWLVIRIRRT